MIQSWYKREEDFLLQFIASDANSSRQNVKLGHKPDCWPTKEWDSINNDKLTGIFKHKLNNCAKVKLIWAYYIKLSVQNFFSKINW